jgi:hypothetical protein
MKETLPPPIEITQAACEEHIKGIANQLGVNKSWIYRICSDAEHDYLTRFLTFHDAVLAENPDGARALIDYINAWYWGKTTGELIKGASWDETLADALNIFADAVRTRKGNPLFHMKIARVIRTLEWLLRQQAADRIECPDVGVTGAG